MEFGLEWSFEPSKKRLTTYYLVFRERVQCKYLRTELGFGVIAET